MINDNENSNSETAEEEGAIADIPPFPDKEFRLTWNGWPPGETLCAIARWCAPFDLEKALEYYRAAALVQPEYGYSFVGIGKTLLDLKRYQELIEELGPIAPTRKHPSLNYFLAIALHEEGHYAQAIESLRRNYIISAFPLPSVLLQARYHWEQGDYEDLYELTSWALPKNPDTVELKLFHALALAHRGEIDAAQAVMDSIKHKSKIKFGSLLTAIDSLLKSTETGRPHLGSRNDGTSQESIPRDLPPEK